MRAVIFAAVVLATTAAHADDRARAKQLYERGLAHYNAAEYQEAITAWKQALQIQPSALLLFNIGQAYRLSGDCTEAIAFYDNYAREAPNASNHDELEQARALCKAQPKPPPPIEPTPPPAPVPVVVAPPIAVEPPPPPPERSHAKRTAGIAIGAVGVALDAAAIYFALDSASQSNTLNHYMGPWTQSQADTQQQGQRDVTLAYTLGAVGIAAVITGAVLFVLDRGDSSEHAVTAVPIRGGATLTWTRRF